MSNQCESELFSIEVAKRAKHPGNRLGIWTI